MTDDEMTTIIERSVREIVAAITAYVADQLNAVREPEQPQPDHREINCTGASTQVASVPQPGVDQWGRKIGFGRPVSGTDRSPNVR